MRVVAFLIITSCSPSVFTTSSPERSTPGCYNFSIPPGSIEHVQQVFYDHFDCFEELPLSKDIRLTRRGLAVEGDTLQFSVHRLRRELGRGANGIVFLARNRLLDRDEALKVWLKLRASDSRDKFAQGLREARKACAAAGKYVVPIYNAGTIGNRYFYATMEFVKARTLAEYLKSGPDLQERSHLAVTYVEALQATAAAGILHGDPHAHNVLVLEKPYPHKPSKKYFDTIKLLDFGTSRFTAPARHDERHWRVVDETIQRIFATEFGANWSVRNNWAAEFSPSQYIGRLRVYWEEARWMRYYPFAEDRGTYPGF
jgi:serine/threonine protein kinase